MRNCTQEKKVKSRKSRNLSFCLKQIEVFEMPPKTKKSKISDESGEEKRTKNPAFTKAEDAYIRGFYKDNKDVLECKDGLSDSNKRKKNKWKELSTILSSQFGNMRTSDKVKKRWINMVSKAKSEKSSQNASRRKTGGGPEEAVISKESDEVLEIIGENNPILLGNSFGLDTADSQEKIQNTIRQIGMRNAEDDDSEIDYDGDMHDNNHVDDDDGAASQYARSMPMLTAELDEAVNTPPIMPAATNLTPSITTTTTNENSSKSKSKSRKTAAEISQAKDEMMIKTMQAEEAKHLADIRRIEAETEAWREIGGAMKAFSQACSTYVANANSSPFNYH
jgi:hypothetical protein